mmetsp:Transcript_103400/g.287941  ORF Transcript_103400/g.287941 Transcript_103400/m.287941 type:complete len:235 (-) Transcript_103400:502-1206(-)
MVSCSAAAWCWNRGVLSSCASFRRVSTLSNSSRRSDPLSRPTTFRTFSRAPSRPCSSQRCKPSRSSSFLILPSESRSMLSYTSFSRSGLRSKSFSSRFSRRSLNCTCPEESPPRRSASSTCSTSVRKYWVPSATRRNQKSDCDSTSSKCCMSCSRPSLPLSSRPCSSSPLRRSIPWSEKRRCSTGVLLLLDSLARSILERLSLMRPSIPGVPGKPSGRSSTEPLRDRPVATGKF